MSLNSDSAGERQRHGKREGHADRAADTEEKEELTGERVRRARHPESREQECSRAERAGREGRSR